jgi:hypothetical protein
MFSTLYSWNRKNEMEPLAGIWYWSLIPSRDQMFRPADGLSDDA